MKKLIEYAAMFVIGCGVTYFFFSEIVIIIILVFIGSWLLT